MSLIEEKTLADHDINVKSIRQELQLLEEQLKKHGRNESQPSPTVTDPDTVSRRSKPHWIPCSERLPLAEYGESDKVLATCGHRDGEDTSIRWIKTLYFNGGNWCYPTGETYEQKVYAWMPLPEPYSKEKK